ncbi:hypothetical protein ACQCN2_12285 [Brevibacillus ginsengisoli]|uniref:hypothetical protein n=1 Tax=Brevibacillus ginsengisoli TaxID=363854 RepID=UPI003CFB9E5E
MLSFYRNCMVWLVLTIVVFLVTGFQSIETSTKASTSEGENRYAVAGIDNPQAFESTFRSVQRLVSQGDKIGVANYIRYPLSVYTNGKKQIIENKQQFIQHYDTIFSPKVKQALINQKVEETFVRDQGVMAGGGEVWFGATDSKPQKYLIITINN